MEQIDNLKSKYYEFCQLFLEHSVFYEKVKPIIQELKDKGEYIRGEFCGVATIDMIEEEWQKGCLPIIMIDCGKMYIKYLPFELFYEEGKVDEYIKTNKEWSLKEFEKTNNKIVEELQHRLDTNDPTLDRKYAEWTINYIKNLKYE